MGTYKRLPRGKRKPVADEFMDWTIKAIHLLQKHARTIALGAGAIVVCIAIIFSVSYYLKYRETNIADNFYKIQKMENMEEKIGALKEFVADHRSSKVGRAASLELANNLFASEQYDQAIAEFKKISEKRSYPALVRVAGFYGLANVLLAQDKFKQAGETFVAAAEMKDNLNKADSFYQAGLCFEKAQDFTKAKKYYEKVLDLSAEGPLKNKVEEQLLWLIAQGK